LMAFKETLFLLVDFFLFCIYKNTPFQFQIDLNYMIFERHLEYQGVNNHGSVPFYLPLMQMCSKQIILFLCK
jgi:hypothetical protein